MGKLPATQRGRYFKQHLNNVVDTVKINFSDIKAGMILLITYHSERRTGPKQSLYVCIQPIYQHYVHVLDLDYVHLSKNPVLLSFTKHKRPVLHEQNKMKKYTRLEFISKDRPLYDLFARITGIKEAYRKLHRDTKHIKTIEAVVYKYKGFPIDPDAAEEQQQRMNVDIDRKEQLDKSERPVE